MVGRLKAAAGAALVRAGLQRRILGEAGIVLAFHRVDDRYTDGLTRSVSDFERFCRFVQTHFDVIPLREFVERMVERRSLRNRLSITFDDGYRDNFTQAAPILRRLGLPATFFVVSDFIESGTVAWWDREKEPAPAWMSWEEVRALRDDGFEIGAHTRSHPDLSRVGAEEASDEIEGCRRAIENRLGSPVTLFAYPYGRADALVEENRDRVRKAGFRCCASCFGGLNRPGDDPFHLRRVAVSDWYATPQQWVFEMATGRG